MAGQREACSHISALLFAAEIYTSLISTSHPLVSSTIRMSTMLPFVTLTSLHPPQRVKECLTKEENESLFLNSSNCVTISKIVPPALKDELEAFYNVLSKTGKPAIIPGYSEDYSRVQFDNLDISIVFRSHLTAAILPQEVLAVSNLKHWYLQSVCVLL